MTWELPKIGERVYRLYHDGELVNSLTWESDRYVDIQGRSLGNNFNTAKALAEKGACKPAKPVTAAQLGLKL